MSIETDSTPLEDPKNPDTCNALLFILYYRGTNRLWKHFTLWKLRLRHAKQALYELICETLPKEK
jgi:tryptophanyl-tRNA synthetase